MTDRLESLRKLPHEMRDASTDMTSEVFVAPKVVTRWAQIVAAFLAAEDARQQDEAKLRKVYEHARGMCFGYDWNNGSSAGHHRANLIAAVNAIEPTPEPESHGPHRQPAIAAQGAQEPVADEGYPGIAHDFEQAKSRLRECRQARQQMRAALIAMRDECALPEDLDEPSCRAWAGGYACAVDKMLAASPPAPVLTDPDRVIAELAKSEPSAWAWSSGDCRGNYSDGVQKQRPGRGSVMDDETPLYSARQVRAALESAMGGDAK